MAATAGAKRLSVTGGYRRSDVGEFAAREDSVGQARAFVRGELAGFPLLDDAELCTSELATNAVRYGSERGDVFWVVVRRRGGWAYVAVIDCGGATVPHLVDAGADAETCRGLALVEAFSWKWGTRPTPAGGWRVWFEVGVP